MCSEKQESHLSWHSGCPGIVNLGQRIYSDNYIIIIFFALDQERRVIQLAVVRNVLTLSVVIACTGIKFHMCTVLVKK